MEDFKELNSFSGADFYIANHGSMLKTYDPALVILLMFFPC